MKIHFTTEGGFGYFPGLNKALVINTETLPAEEANHVEQLVSESGFFDILSKRMAPSKGADLMKYTVTVENQGRQHTITLSDMESNSSLRNLLNYLRQKQKEERSK